MNRQLVPIALGIWTLAHNGGYERQRVVHLLALVATKCSNFKGRWYQSRVPLLVSWLLNSRHWSHSQFVAGSSRTNRLILGPGIFHCGDCSRLALLPEVIVPAVGVPLILWARPL